MKELKNRWISILRQKASQYEHTPRGKGELVVSPDLDTLANEIEAFFTGLTSGVKSKD